MPHAVLWDMDGTLVDTEPYWMAAETSLVEEYGGTWSMEQALQLVGNGLMDSARILQATGVDMPADDIVQRLTDDVRGLLRTQGVPFRPGARELLADLKANGVPTGLVTMSLRRMADAVVDLIGFDAFDVIIAGDEVARPKPYPEPYFAGAAALGVDISDTLALEDSPTGLRSALSSGAVTIGIPHIVSLDGLGAHELWSTLESRTTHDIAVAHAAHRTGRSTR